LKYYDQAGRLVRRSARTTDEAEAQRLLDGLVREAEVKKFSLLVKVRVAVMVRFRTSQPRIGRSHKSSFSERIEVRDREVIEEMIRRANIELSRLINEKIAQFDEHAT